MLKLLDKTKFLQNIYGYRLFNLKKIHVRNVKNSCSDICYNPPKCYDSSSLQFTIGRRCDGGAIQRFLYEHFWPMEPTRASMYVPLDSYYLKQTTYKYVTEGLCHLAYECPPASAERRLVGVAVSMVWCPRYIDQQRREAERETCQPSRNRIVMLAHFTESARLFEKFGLDKYVEIEVLAVCRDVSGHGVGLKLSQHAIDFAFELDHKLVRVDATSLYTAKIMEKLKLKKQWQIKYLDYKAEPVCGRYKQVIWPRSPHDTYTVYVADKPTHLLARGK